MDGAERRGQSLTSSPAVSRGPNLAGSETASSFQIAPPSISLPKGGGAIRGIGEKFSANPVTGTASMSVPIATSPGRGGVGPQLALSYDSGAGNGPFGLGWNLSLPSITRKTDKGLPRYLDDEESDTFILAGAEDLVRMLDSKGAIIADESVSLYGDYYHVRLYRPRVEGLFARVERWSRVGHADEVFWRTISRDNVTTWFGRTPESRILNPSDATRIFKWLISETYDDKGNVVGYLYQKEDGAGMRASDLWESNRPLQQACANTYLKRIRYGNLRPYLPTLAQTGSWEAPSDDPDAWMFEVVCDYGDHTGASPGRQPNAEWPVRADPFSTHRAGFEIRTYRLCRRMLMFHHFPAFGAIPEAPEVGRDCLVRSTDFDYSEPTRLDDPLTPGYTVLASVTQRSYQRRSSDATTYEQRELPPVMFTYSPTAIDPTLRTIDSEQLENLPVGTQGSGYQWVDLDGEGLSGVLTEQAGAWHYKPNLGDGRFGQTRVVARKPAMAALAGGRQQLIDLAGNGEIDLVDFSGPTPGFHERSRDDGWRRHVPFASLPNIDWNDPNLRFVDLTGDGHADALITESEVFTWYPSLDERGFARSQRSRQPLDEDDGPRVVFADAVQTVFLADMCGDGLTDIVRIRNGEICYWPNLGYGRFGRKVTLGNAPRFDSPDLFDPRRIRLTDIDGSGPIDLIYLGRNGAQLYFNRSGNSLSDERLIPLPPATENLEAVQVADLLGNGTACLVWNSQLPADAQRPVRYIRLMGAPSEADDELRKHAKPHLLIKVDNNLGLTTEIEYTPSTWFYLQDQAAGTPWITRLPFPVHCVSRVSAHDKWRGTTFSNAFSYHHGYFDGVEREFRGFGRVEQVDIDDYGTFLAGNTASPWITDDLTLYQPPVHTITWYHTGAALDRQRILTQFAAEYFPQRFAGQLAAATFVERTLPEPELPTGLTAAEWREALRACTGMVLRQEVYELDIDDLTTKPPARTPVRLFTAATHNCRLRCLQPRGENRHAVFLVTESEAITYHHELSLRANKQPIADLQPDPRIAHTLNLRNDEYGNPQQSVVVGYARWGTATYSCLPRPALAQGVQSEEHVAYTEIRYTKKDVALDASGQDEHTGSTLALRHHRLRVPCETRTYELKGMPKNGARYYTIDDFYPLELSDHYAPLAAPSKPVALKQYHQFADGSAAQKRLVEHGRSLYFDDASDTAPPTSKLPFSQHGPRGLKFEDYTLALTNDLLDAVFVERDPSTGVVTDDKLAWEVEPGISARQVLEVPIAPASKFLKSGYVPGTAIDAMFAGQYWTRAGIAGFAADAHEHFFLPNRYTDPFGNPTELTYDERDLFVASSKDAKDNVTRVQRFDFRVLAPVELVDINGNHSEAVFDIRGLVIAAAAKGKEITAGQWQGDNVDAFDFSLANPAAGAVVAFCTGHQFGAAELQSARDWLADASSRFIYHFGESFDVGGGVHWGTHMPGACAIVREVYASQSAGNPSPLQIALECSDGGGAMFMKKVQAEPDPESTISPAPRRWLISGLTLLNNKGRPVKQFEPDFTVDFGCEMPQPNGVCTTMFYDAPGRLVRTEFPDGTVSRVVFSPWDTESWDPNDTVLESQWRTKKGRDTLPAANALPIGANGLVSADADERAGWLAAQHAETPFRTILDSLGREVIAVAHNRVEFTAGNPPRTYLFGGKDWKDEYYVTFTKVDAEGRPLWIRDARGNLVMQYVTPLKKTRFADEDNEGLPRRVDPVSGETIYSAPCYDIAGNLLFQHSMDAGDRWMLMDAVGKPMLAWDYNERRDDRDIGSDERRLFSSVYDECHRPTALKLKAWSRNHGTGNPFATQPSEMLERFEYRDGAGPDPANLNGQLVRHYDTSGLVQIVRRDFAGNVQEVRRSLVADPTVPQTDWTSLTKPDGSSKLEGETYIQITGHDALGRMTRMYNWHRPGTTVAVYERTYNLRGMLQAEALRLHATKTIGGHDPNSGQLVQAIKNIRYNAKGQKTRLELGSGTVTRYTYDAQTFRLVHLYTRRTQAEFASDCASDPDVTQPPRPCGVQNLHYTYDAVGNITHVHDDAQQTIYFKGDAAEPSNDYTYDALYRLTEASGREQAGVTASPQPSEGQWPSGPIPSDATLRRYTQRYTYDEVGNFRRFQHIAQGGSWTRYYEVAQDSNRLMHTWEGDSLRANGTKVVDYAHDPHGNMLNVGATPAEFALHWDCRDVIRHIGLGGGGEVWYQCDSSKQRTRKYIKRIGATVEERVYLSGFERYQRKVAGTVVEEIESQHLFEADRRVLLVDDVLMADPLHQPGPSGLRIDAATVLRYQYGNHLGSVGVELDESARVISHEEFHPYGTSAYRSMHSSIQAPAKRYRYTGMERDEESGLSYHGARYYVPGLGTWSATDPSGIRHGLNIYQYCHDAPLIDVDKNGAEPGTFFETLGGYFVGVGESFEAMADMGLGFFNFFYEGALGLQYNEGRGTGWYQGYTYRMGYEHQISRVQSIKAAVEVLTSDRGPEALWKGFTAPLAAMFAEIEAGNAPLAAKNLGSFVPGFMATVSSFWKGGSGLASTADRAISGLLSNADRAFAFEGAMTAGSSPNIGLLGGPRRAPSATALIMEARAARGEGAAANASVQSEYLASQGAKAPSQLPFKSYWNLQELLSAAFLERSLGLLVYREIPLFELTDKRTLVDLKRRVDALIVEVATGRQALAEWSTSRSILTGEKKFAQMERQLEAFGRARSGQSSIVAQLRGGGLLDVTYAETFLGEYPHWDPKSAEIYRGAF